MDTYVANQYLFCSYRVGNREVWALQIPARHLTAEDVGCWVLFDVADPTIELRWDGKIEQVRKGRRSVAGTGAILDVVYVHAAGIDYELAPDEQVWLGWSPDGPHQRGGFIR